MSEDTLEPITEYFAIVKSVTSRWATPGITKVEQYTDGINKEDKSMSQCGKFYVYGAGYVFMSACFPLTIPFGYSIEDEIDVCNKAINSIRNEAYKCMEQAIEVPKARLTELLQLSHQPAAPEAPVPYTDDVNVVPPIDKAEILFADAELYDREFGQSDDEFNAMMDDAIGERPL